MEKKIEKDLVYWGFKELKERAHSIVRKYGRLLQDLCKAQSTG